MKKEKKDLFKQILKNVETLTSSSATHAVQQVQKFIADAEKDKQNFETQRAYLQSQTQLQEYIFHLKKLCAYALSQMPTHVVFWGNVSEHALEISHCNGRFSINLDKGYCTCDLPKNFHGFDKQLTGIFQSIWNATVRNLEEKLAEQADQRKMQFLEEIYTGIFTGKSDMAMCQEYASMYKAHISYLIVVNNVVTTETAENIEIQFDASFNDAGLSPCYWNSNIARF